MRWAKTVLAEIFGLFVDDGSFALAILIWVGAVWLAAPQFDALARWRGPILFVGLAVILAESALRKARQASGRASQSELRKGVDAGAS